MAGFDFGSLIGGGLGGAAAGSAFGPIGAVGGALLGGLGGAFGGGGPEEYQPTPLQEDLMGYGRKQVRASPKLKKAIKQEFKSLREGGNRAAAEAFLGAYRDRFKNTGFVDKKLAKSYGKDIDFTGPGFSELAKSIYGQQGIGFTGEEYGGFADRAKALGIRSPQAFGDMLKQDLIASGKVMTPTQERLSYFFGAPTRDASGRITNKYGAGVNIDYSMANRSA